MKGLVLLLAVLALVITFTSAPATAQQPAGLSPQQIQKLIGEWKGTVTPGDTWFDPNRTLIITERDGRLEAKYGVTGKTLRPIDLSVEFLDGDSVVIRFRTAAGATATLSLIREGWLSGVLKGTGLNEMPMQLLKK